MHVRSVTVLSQSPRGVLTTPRDGHCGPGPQALPCPSTPSQPTHAAGQHKANPAEGGVELMLYNCMKAGTAKNLKAFYSTCMLVHRFAQRERSERGLYL